jgi:hypothetical protein
VHSGGSTPRTPGELTDCPRRVPPRLSASLRQSPANLAEILAHAWTSIPARAACAMRGCDSMGTGCSESAPAGASSRQDVTRATGSAGADGWRGEGARGLPTDDPRRVPSAGVHERGARATSRRLRLHKKRELYRSGCACVPSPFVARRHRTSPGRRPCATRATGSADRHGWADVAMEGAQTERAPRRRPPLALRCSSATSVATQCASTACAS